MPVTNKSVKNIKGITLLFAFLYALLSCTTIFLSISGLSSGTLLLSLFSGIPFSLVIMFFYYGFLVSLQEKSNKGTLLIIIPVLFAIITGYIYSDAENTMLVLLDFISTSVAAAIVAYCTKKKESRSFTCSVTAFVLFAFSVLGVFISLLALSLSQNISISTLLFDGISNFTDAYIAIYNDVASSVSTMYASGTDASSLLANSDFISSRITFIISLMPALIYSFFFFVSFAFTYIADALCKMFGITKEYAYTKYQITPITNLLFTIVGIIAMLSLFFDAGISTFTCGTLNVLIILLPHYIIFGTRRIFSILKRRFSVGASLILLFVLGALGLSISPAILILVIIFFGTNEYKKSRFPL